MDPKNPEGYRDSYAKTGLESVVYPPGEQIPDYKPCYQDNLSPIVYLVGVGFTVLAGVCCVFAGASIPSQSTQVANAIKTLDSGGWKRNFLTLVLHLTVTICAGATGSVYGTAQRFAMASDEPPRLGFNSDLSLLSGASGWSNGRLCNIVLEILLVISLCSSTLLTQTIVYLDEVLPDDALAAVTIISPTPLIVLGLAFLLQAMIAIASVRSIDILTWSPSLFDISAALVHAGKIRRKPGRCMCGVTVVAGEAIDEAQPRPMKPSRRQSSAWGAHQGVRKAVITLWLLVILWVTCGVIIFKYPFKYKVLGAWSFLPGEQSTVLAYVISPSNGTRWYYWVLYYMNTILLQGLMTWTLQSAGLIANVIRDEKMWRKATTSGIIISKFRPSDFYFGWFLGFTFGMLQSVFHWMLSLAVQLHMVGLANANVFDFDVWMGMLPFQIFNYTIALSILSLVLTGLAIHRPSGPQPAAYGHLQTLANLIDEWPVTKMWWGHKSSDHAGTSNVQLDEVDMDTQYE